MITKDAGIPQQINNFRFDENLLRGELSPAEEALHLARRKELFILIAESGANSPTFNGRGNKAFAQDAAEKTGENKREINRKIARAAALGDDIKDVA